MNRTVQPINGFFLCVNTCWVCKLENLQIVEFFIGLARMAKKWTFSNLQIVCVVLILALANVFITMDQEKTKFCSSVQKKIMFNISNALLIVSQCQKKTSNFLRETKTSYCKWRSINCSIRRILINWSIFCTSSHFKTLSGHYYNLCFQVVSKGSAF